MPVVPPPSGQDMIRLEGVSLRVGATAILEDVDLHVRPGDKVVLTGPSGSGKSSLLKVVLGVYRISAGSLTVAGVPVSASTVGAARKGIAYVPQSIPVFPGETARAFLELPFSFRANRGERPDPERVSSVLDSLGLSEGLLERSTSALSGGERQSMALARALLLGRTTFLLDEVSSAIDGEARERVARALLDDPAVTVLSVSHDDAWIARSTTLVRLVAGRVVSLERDGPGAQP